MALILDCLFKIRSLTSGEFEINSYKGVSHNNPIRCRKKSYTLFNKEYNIKYYKKSNTFSYILMYMINLLNILNKDPLKFQISLHPD